ncbi:hypothetical protein I5632_001817 [Salmonella enterica]|nr:hypothetical protein [Salmonella enterica]
MFPAPAGINRAPLRGIRQQVSVPRASGDKPKSMPAILDMLQCSPRQRG